MENANKPTIDKAHLEDWIDCYDVMHMLRISYRTLQTFRSNGMIPFSRIGKKVYFLRQDIEKILADNYKMNLIRYDYGKSNK